MSKKVFKQLYIRKGNLESNSNILIIGEESELGGRDPAYCTKGTLKENCLIKKDPYTGTIGSSYIHACKNIVLTSKIYKSDHDIHNYVKKYCKDLIKWDGESVDGLTNSREAFICRSSDINKTVKILRKRIVNLIRPKNIFGVIRNFYIQHSLTKKKTTKENLKLRLKILVYLTLALFFFLLYISPELRENLFNYLKTLFNFLIKKLAQKVSAI